MNTQGVNIKNLKTFMKYANNKGYTKNTEYIDAFKVQKRDPDMIALNQDELSKIEDYEPETLSLQQTKDCFLIQVYTGLRYSDLANLRKQNFDASSMVIQITTIKTEGKLRIPIGKKLFEILERIDWELPIISNQKYNDNIKDLCKGAGIDTSTTIVEYRGNGRKEVTEPKWKFISSHTARRTFITLALKANKLPEKVMKISGHKSRTSFQRYVRITQEEAVEDMRDLFD
jgi:integrase